MEILDQENKGEEAYIEDIIRVLKTYSKSMNDKDIEMFLKIN